MKFIASFLLMILLGFASGLYFPWWSISISCFIVALAIPLKPLLALLTGFLAMFFLWSGLSMWISTNNDHILAHKVSLLLMQADNPMLLVLITGLVGGVTGGLSALSGSLLRSVKR